MGKQSTIRNCGVSPPQERIYGKVFNFVFKGKNITLWLHIEALEISWVHNRSSAIY